MASELWYIDCTIHQASGSVREAVNDFSAHWSTACVTLSSAAFLIEHSPLLSSTTITTGQSQASTANQVGTSSAAFEASAQPPHFGGASMAKSKIRPSHLRAQSIATPEPAIEHSVKEAEAAQKAAHVMNDAPKANSANFAPRTSPSSSSTRLFAGPHLPRS